MFIASINSIPIIRVEEEAVMDLCTLTENGFLNQHTISTKSFGKPCPHYQPNGK